LRDSIFPPNSSSSPFPEKNVPEPAVHSDECWRKEAIQKPEDSETSDPFAAVAVNHFSSDLADHDDCPEDDALPSGGLMFDSVGDAGCCHREYTNCGEDNGCG